MTTSCRRAREWKRSDRRCLGPKAPNPPGLRHAAGWHNVASYWHCKHLIKQNTGAISYGKLVDTIHHLDIAKTRPAEMVRQVASNLWFIQYAFTCEWLDLAA